MSIRLALPLALALPPLVLAAGACSSLPHPPYRAQDPAFLVPVDFGPPPGRIERIPRRPEGADAWVDGEWIRRRGRWYWLVGRWVKTPPGASYSPWVTVRAVDGSLYYAPSMWRDATGRAIDAPPALTYATASGEAVFTPEGDAEQTGRNLKTAPAPPIKPPPSATATAPPAPTAREREEDAGTPSTPPSPEFETASPEPETAAPKSDTAVPDGGAPTDGGASKEPDGAPSDGRAPNEKDAR